MFSKGNNVVIRDGVKIGENVVLGDNVVIDYNCIVRDNVVIEEGTYIGPYCIIGEYLRDYYNDKNYSNPLFHFLSTSIQSSIEIHFFTF